MANIQPAQLSRTNIQLVPIYAYDLIGDDENAISYLNALIYILLPPCTMSNIFLLSVHFTRKEKNFFTYFMPQYVVAQQVSLSIFVISNFYVGERIFASSKFACFIFAYLAHLSSSYVNWILASVPFIIRNLLNNSIRSYTFKLTMRVIYALPLLLSVVYLVDIFYMDLTSDMRIMNTTSASNVSQEELCTFSNIYALMLRDLIDLLFFFVFPFCFVLYNLFRLDSREKLISEMKIIMPFAFMLFCSPVVLIPIIRDVHLFLNDSIEESPTKLYFTLAQILYQIFPIFLASIDSYFNKYNRNFILQILFEKYRNAEASHLEPGNSTIRESPNGEICLEELTQLDT